MAAVLHGSARTTPRVRAELQASQEATGILASRYGLSRTTVTKWRTRTTTHDAPMGPTTPHSTVLTLAEEATVVEFRRRTLLPLDDVMGCLRDSIPKLTRASLHRCLKRHGISRLPENPDKASKRGKFVKTTIGYVHIAAANPTDFRDISELRLAQGKLNMFLAIDRVSKAKPLGLRRVHLCRVPRRRRKDERRRVPAQRGQGVPLCHPHRADRQRHGLRRPAEKPQRPDQALSRRPHLRPRLRQARDRAQVDQTLPPLDQRTGRTHEPHRQRSHHQGVPLPRP